MLFELVFKIIFFIGCSIFVLRTLNRLPRDISAIIAAWEEKNKRELYAALAEALFCWGLSAVFVIFFVIPIGGDIIEGYAGWFKFLSGF